MASALRTKLHSPVPPYASWPAVVMFPLLSRTAAAACRFHSSMPRIIGASCEVPITMPYAVAVAWFCGSSSSNALPQTAGQT